MSTAPVDTPAPAGQPYLRTEAARAKAAEHIHEQPPASPVILQVLVRTTDGTEHPQWIYPCEHLKCILTELALDDEVLTITPLAGIDPETGDVLGLHEVARRFEVRDR